jgi:hypothetical protein
MVPRGSLAGYGIINDLEIQEITKKRKNKKMKKESLSVIQKRINKAERLQHILTCANNAIYREEPRILQIYLFMITDDIAEYNPDITYTQILEDIRHVPYDQLKKMIHNTLNKVMEEYNNDLCLLNYAKKREAKEKEEGNK